MFDKKDINFMEFLMILFLFEPTIMVKFDFLNYGYVFLGCISFVYIIYKLMKYGKTNNITITVIIFQLIYLGITIVNNGDILKVGYLSIVIVSIMLYAFFFDQENRFSVFIYYLKQIFLCYLFINLITYIVFPKGIGQFSRMYFLGYRTRFTEYSILLIVLSIISKSLNINDTKKTFFEILIAVLNILLPKVSTAIVGVIILFLVQKICVRIKNVNYRTIFLLFLIINLLVVFFRIQIYFSYIIEDLLGKSVSLTNRTMIWDASYKYIFDNNLIFGHGYQANGNFVYIYGTYWQSHNQILQLLYEVGFIGIGLFYYIVLYSLKQLETDDFYNKKKICSWIGAAFISFSVMMITEIYSYYIPFYVLITLAIYTNKSIKDKLEEKKYDKK